MTEVLNARMVRFAVGALAALALFTATTVLAADQMSRPFAG